MKWLLRISNFLLKRQHQQGNSAKTDQVLLKDNQYLMPPLAATSSNIKTHTTKDIDKEGFEIPAYHKKQRRRAANNVTQRKTVLGNAKNIKNIIDPTDIYSFLGLMERLY